MVRCAYLGLFERNATEAAANSAGNPFLTALAALQNVDWRRQNFSDAEIENMLATIEKLSNASDALATIYVITPTYARPAQKADLTRMCNTLRLVPKLHWLLVEDSPNRTKLVANLLRSCGVCHSHLNASTDPRYKHNGSENWAAKPRGVDQRNEGLRWLRSQTHASNAVVYFADDDNSYSLRIFEEVSRFFSLNGDLDFI